MSTKGEGDHDELLADVAALVKSHISRGAFRKRPGAVLERPWVAYLCGPAPAYVRGEGERYIVTDLGNGLRGYAIRTNSIEIPPLRAHGVCMQDGRILACTRADSRLLTMSRSDLPAAIVRVMRASAALAFG